MGYANCKHLPQTSPIHVGPVTAKVSHTRAPKYRPRGYEPGANNSVMGKKS